MARGSAATAVRLAPISLQGRAPGKARPHIRVASCDPGRRAPPAPAAGACAGAV